MVAFCPLDWEPVSPHQLRHYNDVLPHLRSLDAELVAISVDSVYCHQAFRREVGLGFRLLSDAQPRGAVARSYGVYRPQQGQSARALFVINATGVISWGYVAPPMVDPGVDGMLTALERLARHREGHKEVTARRGAIEWPEARAARQLSTGRGRASRVLGCGGHNGARSKHGVWPS